MPRVVQADLLIRCEWRRLGFGFQKEQLDLGGFDAEAISLLMATSEGNWERATHYGVEVPYWFVAVLTASLPAGTIARRLRARTRRRTGLCPTCGYNLRATPDRCPECGGVPKEATS